MTTALQLTPCRTRDAGPPRKPPFDAACWTYDFDLRDSRDLGPALNDIATRLAPQQPFFYRLVNESGFVALHCGVFAAGNWDEILDYQLMRRLAELCIDLRLDVYPQSTAK